MPILAGSKRAANFRCRSAANRLKSAALRNSAWALGTRRVSLLLAAIVEDRSWYDIGNQLGVSHKTAKLRAFEAIAALHLCRTGKPVPAPPREKFRNQPGSW